MTQDNVIYLRQKPTVVSDPIHEDSRWVATVHYSDIGGLGGGFVSFYFDEFEELGEMVESGPDWDKITTFIVELRKP